MVQYSKIDFCSNLKWINDEEKFNHSINFGHDGNIWQVGELKPYSKYVEQYQIKDFQDFAIPKKLILMVKYFLRKV